MQQQADANVTAGNVISTNPSAGSSISKGGTVTLYVSKGAAPILLPNVQNEQYNTAAQQLKALGFTNVNPVADNQSSLPSGEVDHMSPTPNQKYAPSEQITLYYSGGGIPVPTVTGVPLSTALQELKSAGFTSHAERRTTPTARSTRTSPSGPCGSSSRPRAPCRRTR